MPNSPESTGLQIDLLIDRKDEVINLCEIKFYSTPFTITKSYYQELLRKRQLFLDVTETKKQVFITLITNYGVATNAYSREVVDAEIQLEQLIN